MTIIERMIRIADRYRLMTGCAIIIVSALFWVPRLAGAWMHTGGEPFQGMANDLMDGKLPYRDREFGYPPYSVLIFVLPRLLFGQNNYLGGFMMLVFLADCGVKILLLYLGLQGSKTSRALLPVLVYSVAMPFLQEFFLLRYDVWPALISLAAIWLFCNRRHFLSGLAIAIGIGVKVYPVIFMLPLAVLAVRQKKGWRFGAGLAAGLFPIALLGFFLPWWSFVQFQGERGLQVESLYASLLWMGKQLGLLQVRWEWNISWFEIHGPLASSALVWAQATFVVAVAVSTLFGAWTAAHCKKNTPAQVARLLLLPLLGFVDFNLVFSPQFMIWLLPLASVGILEGSSWPVLPIFLATLVTPFFYPCPEYNSGLNFYETVGLVYRNLLLVTAWIMLIGEAIHASYRNKTS